MQKNVAGQQWIVFAFDLTDNTPLTGDAANITGNLRLDGGAANAIDDTNPRRPKNPEIIRITPIITTITFSITLKTL